MPPDLGVHGTERVVKEIDVSILVHSSEIETHAQNILYYLAVNTQQILWYYSIIAVGTTVL